VGKGTDEYMEKLKREAHNLQLEEKIIFTGFRNDIPKIMSAMDVFVLATFYEEGLSRVILEAMAAGIPVIASAIGGNPEVVMHGENGMLVQTGNAELLAKAILKISSDAEMLKQMGKKARKHVASKFSIEENVNKIQNVYEEILCLDT
jgi:glycosyltransferase involved in cell wall biosynthesis